MDFAGNVQDAFDLACIPLEQDSKIHGEQKPVLEKRDGVDTYKIVLKEQILPIRNDIQLNDAFPEEEYMLVRIKKSDIYRNAPKPQVK